MNKLLKYYLSCIEEEDLRSRQVNSDAFNRQYLAPKADQGGLFKDATEISWTISKKELKFLQRYSTEKEQPSYLYGYPIYRDKFGFLLPLFMSEVEVDIDSKDMKPTLSLIHPDNLQVNLHLFRNTHPSLIERLDLQDVLESNEFGSFNDRIKVALEERQESSTKLDELITSKGKPGWKNGSILVRDTGGHFTAQLRRELSEMQNLTEKVNNTSLGILLNLDKTSKLNPEPIDLLEIIELNQSQREAATAALNQPFTIITGPPGTGKSQVVVALVASMAAAGKPVLFVSKNNEAVEVVRRKLAKILGDGDWTLRLGSKRNIDQEMERLIEKAMTYKPSGSRDYSEEWQNLTKYIGKRQKLLDYNLKAHRLMSDYAKALGRQRKYVANLPEEWQDWWDDDLLTSWPESKKRNKIKRYIEDIEALANKRWPGLWLYLLRLFYGHRLIRNYQENFLKNIGNLPDGLPEWYHEDELSWEKLLLDIQVINNIYDIQKESVNLKNLVSEIESIPLSDHIKKDTKIIGERIITASRKVCHSKINSRVEKKLKFLPSILKEYWGMTKKAAFFPPKAAVQLQKDFSKSANKLLSIMPTVIVTSLSARRSLPLEANMFDCVIIDEASQCDIASALPLMFRAKRMTVIGDPRQLRHISSINEKSEQRIAHTEGAKHLLSRYSYRTKSLYDCSAEVAETNNEAPFFLAEHYRSQPNIIEFSNRVYYNRRLIVRTPVSNEETQSLLWHDIPSQVDSGKGSLLNKKEAEEVLKLSKHLTETTLSNNEDTIGIVTPYKRQRNYIDNLLRRSGILKILGDRLRIGTIHTFQGGETDIMIFSPVLTNGVNLRAAEWISKEEGLLNVALTRAKKALHIVGDKSFCLQTPGPIGELAQFIDYLSESSQSQKSATPPVQKVCDILNEINIWYQREWPEGGKSKSYYLDFMVVGLSGTRYDIEIDGRQHYFSAEAIAEDDARDAFLKKLGYQVIRIRAKDVMKSPDLINNLLGRLV